MRNVPGRIPRRRTLNRRHPAGSPCRLGGWTAPRHRTSTGGLKQTVDAALSGRPRTGAPSGYEPVLNRTCLTIRESTGAPRAIPSGGRKTAWTRSANVPAPPHRHQRQQHQPYDPPRLRSRIPGAAGCWPVWAWLRRVRSYSAPVEPARGRHRLPPAVPPAGPPSYGTPRWCSPWTQPWATDRWAREGADVLMRGGAVAAVGRRLGVPAGTRVIDASDRLLMPVSSTSTPTSGSPRCAAAARVVTSSAGWPHATGRRSPGSHRPTCTGSFAWRPSTPCSPG